MRCCRPRSPAASDRGTRGAAARRTAAAARRGRSD